MKKARKKSNRAAEPRRRAAAKRAGGKSKARDRTPRAAGNPKSAADARAAQLVRELKAYQAELQSQNDELRDTREAVDLAMERYADLYDFAPVGYLTLQRNGTIIQSNLTGANLLQADRSRLKGARLAFFVSEPDRPKISRLLNQVFATGARQSCEVELRIKDRPGAMAHVEATLSADRQCRVVLIDVTSRWRAESALRDRDERSRAVLEDQTEIISRFRADGTLTIVNDAFGRFFGKPKDELIGSKWQPHVVADDLPAIMRDLDQLSPANPVVVIENRVINGEGEARWMQFVNRAFFDKRGRIVEMQSVGRDITRSRLAEEALRESEARWRFAVEGTGDGLWDWDVRTGKVVLSRQWKRMLGYEEDEIGDDFTEWRDRVHPEDLPETENAIRAFIEGRTSKYSAEFRMRCKDGSWKWIHARGVAISVDADGRPQRIIGRHTDISERKAARQREETNLRLVAEGAPSAAVLDAIVRSVEADHPGMVGCVLLMDASSERVLEVIAPRLPVYIQKALRGCAITPDMACVASAVRTGGRVVTEDIQSGCKEGAVEKLAARAKLRSCWAEPVVSGTGLVLGAIVCFRRVPHRPAGAEISEVAAAARLTALAIERRQAEHALRESEERYRLLADHIDDIVGLSDTTGNGLYISPSFYRKTGWTPAEIKHSDWRARMHPDDIELAERTRAENLAGKTTHVEHRLLCRDGSWIWLHSHCKPILDAHGNVWRLLVWAADITDQKKAADALRESEERYARAVRGTNSGLWDWNIKTGECYISPRWKELLGFADDELPGSREIAFLQRIHPDDVATVTAARRAHLEEDAPYDIETRLRMKNGEYRWFRICGQAERDAAGVPVRMAGATSDIQARKDAEAALRESEERYRLLAENTDDIVGLNDTKGTRLYLSPSYYRKTGWTEDDLNSTDWRARIHPEDLPLFERTFRANLEGATTTIEYRFRCKNGSWLNLETTCKPLSGPDGQTGKLLRWSHDITERRQAEAALRESEERYRAIVEQAAVGVTTIDSNTGRYLSVNQRHCDITGRTREQILAVTHMDITHPDDLLVDEQNMKKLRSGAIRSLTVEKRYIRPDGSITWVNVTVSPMWQPGEVPTTHIAVVEDITARKAAEAALRDSEKKFRTLFESAGDAIFIMDGDRFVDCNSPTLQMFGCQSRDQIIGHPPYEFSPQLQPNGRNSEESALRRITAALAGRPQFFEWLHTRRDGSPFPAEVSLNKIELGNKVLLQAIVRDITGRKQAEAALRESEERFRAIFEQAAVGVALIDTNTGRFLSVNQRGCDIARLTREEMLASTFMDITHPDDLQPDLELMDKLKAGEIPNFTMEKRYLHRDGTITWVNLTVSPMWKPGEPPIRHVAVVEDITARKTAESALQTSDERYARVIRGTTDGMWDWFIPTGELYLSPRWKELLGFMDDELPNHQDSFFKRLHPDDEGRVRDALKEHMEMGEPYDLELRLQTKSGGYRWVRARGEVEWDENRHATHMAGTISDISERKLVQEHYAREQEMNRILVGNTSALIVVLDEQARVTHVNPAFERELGYGLADLGGRHLWDSGMMSAAEIPRAKERYRKLVDAETPSPVEIRLRARNGEWHVLELRPTATYHSDKSLERIILTFTDITERNRLQHEVLKISEQEQASIGHNLHDGVGQTMSGIASMLEHLESGLTGEPRKQAARIRELMQQSVAEVRRMSHGLSPMAVQLRGLGGGLQLLAETVRTNYRTEAVCEVDSGIAINDSEKETHLYRIAQEAINNALRHGRAKRIGITLRRVSDTECELEVEDNGVGISKADARQSNGVGLRVMQYRASLIGGELQVTSRPKGGVTVTCRFPCACKPAVKIAKRAKKSP